MEQLPGSVSQPEERAAILCDKETVVVAHLQPWQRLPGCPGLLRLQGYQERQDERPANCFVKAERSHRFAITVGLEHAFGIVGNYLRLGQTSNDITTGFCRRDKRRPAKRRVSGIL